MGERRKIVTVVGARPQFVKAWPLSARLRERAEEVVVHTGQHYDQNMSERFFVELGLPEPAYNLGVGSGSHGAQTGAMLARLEEVLLRERPDWVVVFGDTNSTLAGALAAVKLALPVAHVEAGLRSGVMTMPEEINRVIVDRISSKLFAPTASAAANLAAEGRQDGVEVVGDIMVDALAMGLERARELPDTTLHTPPYCLLTVHRQANADSEERLRDILEAMGRLPQAVVFPCHPRTRARLQGVPVPRNVLVVDPLGYLDMLRAELHADVIVTDSGGVQKEAYLLGVPCVTLRCETEWPETLAHGRNVLVGSEPGAIVAAILHAPARQEASWAPFGDGRAAERIATSLGL